LTKNSATVKQSGVPSLKAKNGPCTQGEWALILESILRGTQASDDQAELLDGVETVASVQENKSIDITIRKRTEVITVSSCNCYGLHGANSHSNGLVLSNYLTMKTKKLNYSNGAAQQLNLLQTRQMSLLLSNPSFKSNNKRSASSMRSLRS
jgi:hypothetical protein